MCEVLQRNMLISNVSQPQPGCSLLNKPLGMEDFLPLWSSLEREQWTLQRLNSSGEEENESSSDELRSHSPSSSCWSSDSLDDELYLEYLFSQVSFHKHLLLSRIETFVSKPLLNNYLKVAQKTYNGEGQQQCQVYSLQCQVAFFKLSLKKSENLSL